MCVWMIYINTSVGSFDFLHYIRVFVYQGVRDLLKAVMDKIQTIPNFVSSAVVQHLLAAREVRLNSQRDRVSGVFHSCDVLLIVLYEGSGLHTGPKRLPAACILCSNGDQKIVSRGGALALGKTHTQTFSNRNYRCIFVVCH